MTQITHSPAITVFTATYNAADTMHRVYESLQQQTFRNFEWVIVDDGSTDNTRQVVDEWKNQRNFFTIRYFYQSHGHKKKAHNRGVKEAKGDMFAILDADDKIFPHALDISYKKWLEITPGDKRSAFMGVLALCVTPDGEVIGKPFLKNESHLIFSQLYIKHRVMGEKFLLLRSDILKKTLYREDIPGWVPPGILWRELSPPYMLLCLNEKLRIYYPQKQSITSLQENNSGKYAQGHMVYIVDVLNTDMKYFFYNIPFFLKTSIKYTRFWLHLINQQHNVSLKIHNPFAKMLICLTAPFGAVVYIYDILMQKG